MKHAPAVQDLSCIVLERIQKEYADLIASSQTFSLEELFDSDRVHLQDFCREFSPHPHSAELRTKAKSFGEKYGIWLSNANHHISCALFLYPTAQIDRMLTMMNNLTIGFYLNDIMGRDTFKFLPKTQKEISSCMIQRMAGVDEILKIPPGAHPIEIANIEILREFKDHSPGQWFRKFLKLYCHHLNITHQDGDSSAQGIIPKVNDYMIRRCHLGGVHHIVHWIEFSESKFMDWDFLKANNISDKLKRLHWVIAAFAGMSNDLFSFEKEVIDSCSDSNLVMIIALNNPALTFTETILHASEIVRSLLCELMILLESIKQDIEKVQQKSPEISKILYTHLSSIVHCVQAIWMWHVYTKRYKRPHSIWKETIL